MSYTYGIVLRWRQSSGGRDVSARLGHTRLVVARHFWFGYGSVLDIRGAMPPLRAKSLEQVWSEMINGTPRQQILDQANAHAVVDTVGADAQPPAPDLTFAPLELNAAAAQILRDVASEYGVTGQLKSEDLERLFTAHGWRRIVNLVGEPRPELREPRMVLTQEEALYLAFKAGERNVRIGPMNSVLAIELRRKATEAGDRPSGPAGAL